MTEHTAPPIDSVDTARAASEMRRSGGHFVIALADCWRVADPVNRSRIELAFPELFVAYEYRARAREER